MARHLAPSPGRSARPVGALAVALGTGLLVFALTGGPTTTELVQPSVVTEPTAGSTEVTVLGSTVERAAPDAAAAVAATFTVPPEPDGPAPTSTPVPPRRPGASPPPSLAPPVSITNPDVRPLPPVPTSTSTTTTTAPPTTTTAPTTTTTEPTTTTTEDPGPPPDGA
jgi:hypothetical protein